jgi:uroporphyrinogen-III decarboxylase
MRKDPFYGSDWALRYYIQSIDDYRLMAYLVENTVFRPRYSSISRAKANLGEDGVVLGRIDRTPYQKLLIELAGPERLLLDLYTNPDPVVSLIEDMNKRMDEQVGLAIESEADVIWQPDNITSDLTPPKEFARFLIPLYEKYGRWCEEAGKVYVVHMDGKLKGLLDSIARTPIHVIESFSFAEMAGDLSVAEALAAWPEKTLCPNFPASLAEKPASEIEDYLEKRSLEFGEAPWMLQISEDIPPGSHLKLLPVLASFFQ